jgi:5'-nucleotidase
MTARRPARLHALVVALLVLGGLAACGGDDDSDGGGGGDGGNDAATTATTEPAPLDVLVTNDDGYDAVGIDALVEALRAEPGLEVTVVAPATNQSGTGDKTTEGDVAHSDQETASGYPAVAVEGFPADSVLVALDELGLTPDLVVSGINVGQNIGPLADISGTVGAAKTAQRQGLPALAVSQGTGAAPEDYEATAQLAVDWVREHQAGLDELAGTGEIASINVPTCPTGEVQGLVEVALGTDGSHVGDPVDCESTAEGFTDDVTAFVNGYASLTAVPSGG